MVIFLLLIVQIIIESFPISSSAHVLMTEQLLQQIIGTEVTLAPMLANIIHLPTVIMLAIYFFKEWSIILLHPLRYRKCILRMIVMGFYAEFATVVWYVGLPLLFKKCGMSLPPYIYGLLLTAVVLCMTYVRKNQQVTHTIRWCDALAIGIAQGIAVVPGISRLGITYATGLACGLSSKKSFLFSCMIEWPLILAGGLYGLCEARVLNMLTPMISLNALCIIGGATVIAYFGLWFTQYLFQTARAYIFGIYLFVIVSITLLLR